MKKLLQEYKFIIISFVILFFSTLLIYFPTLKLNFLLIDDGQIIQNSKVVSQSIREFNFIKLGQVLFEPKEGRVRPAYWLVQAIASNLSFYNPQLMHIARFLILLVSSYLIYLSLKKLKIDYRWIFFSIFLFIFNFQNFENYYRLGPTEIFLGLYFLIGLNIFLKDNIGKYDYLILLVTSLLGNFTKETFFLTYIPVIMIIISSRVASFKKNRLFYIYTLLTSFVFAGVVFFIKSGYGEVLGYAQNYKFSLSEIILNLVNYFNQINHYQSPVLLCVVIYICYWIYHNICKIFSLKSKKDVFTVFFIAEVVLNLLVLLPWKFVLSRYLIIVNISLIFLFAFFAEQFWVVVKNSKYIPVVYEKLAKNIFMVILLPVIFVRNIFPIANFQDWERMDSQLTTDLLKSISKYVPQNQNIIVNYIKGDANIEIFLETKWHLEEFYNRKDITFSYLDDENICTKSDRYVLDRSSDRFVPNNNFIQKNLILVDSGKYNYNPINYGEVTKSFANVERSVNWSQKYGFEWSLYKQKAGTCIVNKNEIQK